ncbi:class I SAM-dependent methyltransferase [Rhodopirellula halodulae]|uniref:class I SAM-dependent methyltransferase n=1 Tax=Rhodopirellula halodulae TaxID=2894198 RepID=UPI001E3104EA|nr:class I SAM-dependent methyltransferase [Rhodopirellula sp. JC737]MCC9657034.1 class I SAM-dependent methyltransferase [Rhodopirellula sp. JC737]
MNRNPSRSERGYDRLAGWYWLLEQPVFRRDLQRAREACLVDLPPMKRILMLGDGDGRLLQKVLMTQPQAKVVSVEQSSEMIALQKRRAASVDASHRVEWIQGDAITVPLQTGSFDCLVAAFFLDCFTEVELSHCLPGWLSCVANDGFFYHVDFVIPENGWRRMRAKFWSWIMHRFFRWQTGLQSASVVPVEPLLDSKVWAERSRRELNHGFIRSVLYQRRSSQLC